MSKKLYRIYDGKKISGVCLGISEYLGIDVTVIRLIWVIATLMTGFICGTVLYILFVFIFPVEPGYIDGTYTEK